MKIKQILTVGLAVATLMLATASTGVAQTKRQKDKNDMRNLGVGLGAFALHKTLKGDTKTGLILGAGAAYAGKKYEDQRKAQNRSRSYQVNHRSYRYSKGKRIGYWIMRGGKRHHYVSYRKR